MSDWAETRVQEAIRRHLKASLEMRPYRRLVVDDGNSYREGCLGMTVTADNTRPDGGGDGGGDYQLWKCVLSLQIGVTGARYGMDSFLELIDIMHEADIDGGELVIIQILFREARLISETDEMDAHRILSSFDVVTVDDRKSPLKHVPDAILVPNV